MRTQSYKKYISRFNDSVKDKFDKYSSSSPSVIKDKNILITGGTGSIGRTILEHILLHEPKHVVLLNRDQHRQLEMQKFYRKRSNIEFQLGDVRNLNTMMNVCKNKDVIFHTAALKDVVLDELNPSESIETNVIGTRNLIYAAVERKAKRVVNISTDKAVYPTSVLGGTKMLAERLITDASRHQKDTIFCNVRFGNVVGSSGSVIPVLVNKIRKKRTVAITDPDMTRFMMTLDDAVQLVLHAAAISMGGETMVLKMKAVRIGNLIEGIKSVVAQNDGFDLKRVKTKIIGSRNGEKTHEMLLSKEELTHVVETNDFLIYNQNFTQTQNGTFDQKWIYSNTVEQFSWSEICKIVSDHLEQDEKRIASN